MSSFAEATRHQLRLRMSLDGPEKSGKSYTALRFAHKLVADCGEGTNGRIAVIDTENRSAEKYSGNAPDGVPWQFKVCNLTSFSPASYMERILEASQEKFCVLIIDSLSHAWAGEGGALELKDRAGSSQQAWSKVTPVQNRMMEAIIRSPCHIIATLRTKTEWLYTTDEKGKSVPQKVGTSPIQRPGIGYEFDILGSMDQDHVMRVHGSRCSAVDGKLVPNPGPSFMDPVIAWLKTGESVELDGASGKLARIYELVRQFDDFDMEKLRPKLRRDYGADRFELLSLDSMDRLIVQMEHKLGT